MNCKDCIVRQYPPCGDGIPCCKCDREECNGRQPCPKKEEKNLDYEEELLLMNDDHGTNRN